MAAAPDEGFARAEALLLDHRRLVAQASEPSLLKVIEIGKPEIVPVVVVPSAELVGSDALSDHVLSAVLLQVIVTEWLLPSASNSSTSVVKLSPVSASEGRLASMPNVEVALGVPLMLVRLIASRLSVEVLLPALMLPSSPTAQP